MTGLALNLFTNIYVLSQMVSKVNNSHPNFPDGRGYSLGGWGRVGRMFRCV